MDDAAGWVLDEATLRPRVLDRARVEHALAEAGPEDRLCYLGVLGRLSEGLAEAADLLRAGPADPWLLLLRTAELHRLGGDPERGAQLQRSAWRHARSRNRQATTMHEVGRSWFEAGELDVAAAHFELALTMRRGFADPDTIGRSEQAVRAVRNQLGFDAIVLAGGSGVRLGGQTLGAKALVPLAGWPLADHVLMAASGAANRVQVGPVRNALARPVFALEDPPGSGPVAGIAAALDQVRAPLVAVLAGDLPFIAGALAALRNAAGRHDAAALVDTTGRINYLAAVWRTAALRQAIARLDSVLNAPVRALYRRAEVEHVPDFDAASADVDTPADLAAATRRIRRRNPERLPATPLAWPRLELHAPS